MVFHIFGPTRLEWVQVEVTTRCQARCRYCPRSVWRDRLIEGDLNPEILDRTLVRLPRGTLVHLQGWGEPLLYPGLAGLVRKVRDAGCVPTTTTNAVALDPDTALRLAEAGLEILGISMTGVDAEHNDRWRCGTEAVRILETAESVANSLMRRGLPGPRLHAAYLLLRSGLSHLPGAVETLASAGFAQIVVSSLDLVPRRELVRETLWDLPERTAEVFQETVRAADERARLAGVEIVLQLATARRRGRCPERPDRSAFIGFDGAVFPCVYTGVPLGRPAAHWLPDGRHELRRLPAGDLNRETLDGVRRERVFRRMARSGRGPLHVTARCRRCAKPLVVRHGREGMEELLLPAAG